MRVGEEADRREGLSGCDDQRSGFPFDIRARRVVGRLIVVLKPDLYAGGGN